MSMLSSDERLPLYQRLRDELARQIADNRWRPGEAIPTEAVLSTEYGLSVGTVRKAIDMLVGERILERQQGRGTFIRRPQFHSSLFRFFRFQTLAGERQMPESQVLEIEPVNAPSAVAHMLGLPAQAPVIRLLRLRVLAAQPLLVEEIWLPRERFQAILGIDLNCLEALARQPDLFNQPLLVEEIWLPRERFQAILGIDLNREGPLLYPIYEELCGQVVASAEETLTAESVSQAHAALLGVEPGSPVVVIERLARNYAGQPLEWRRSRGHASHFRYSVDIR